MAPAATARSRPDESRFTSYEDWHEPFPELRNEAKCKDVIDKGLVLLPTGIPVYLATNGWQTRQARQPAPETARSWAAVAAARAACPARSNVTNCRSRP
jgi:hypothetical protein